MYWRNPGYLWAEVVPGLLVVCWVLTEWIGRRRLRKLGDPEVLGVSHSWVWQFVALLLLVLGLASGAAVLPLPALKAENAVPKTPEIVILLDVNSLAPAAERLWRTLEDGVQAVVEQAPGSRFSVVASGSPPEVLVPPTVDARGVQIIISRLRLALQPRSGTDLSETLAHFTGRQRSALANSHLVVVTALPVEEVGQASAISIENMPGVVLVRVSGDGAPAQYGWRTSMGGWTWTTKPESTRNLLTATTGGRPESRRLSLVQWCALFSFLLLSAEFVCSLAARSKNKGGLFV
jgi:hypothetical protein